MTTGTNPAFEGKKGTVDSAQVMVDRLREVSEKAADDQWQAPAEQAIAHPRDQKAGFSFQLDCTVRTNYQNLIAYWAIAS